MPELVNSRVGSLAGTSELEGTIVWSLERKNSRNAERISEVFMDAGSERIRKGGHAEDAVRFPSHQSNSSPGSSTSARVTARTVAGSKPRRKRNPAREARSA